LLTSQGSGKILSGRWAAERERAAQDSRGYSADQLAYLDIIPGTSVDGKAMDRGDNLTIDTQPIDPNTPSKRKAIDIRTLPDHMGGPGQ